MQDRMERISEGIKREILGILQEEINDPRIRDITITKVEVTRDLRLAKVFYILEDDAEEKEKIAKGLNSASSFIRGELAGRMSLKYTPQISFREDVETEKEESIDKLFEVIEKEHDESPGGEEEGSGDE